MADCRLPRRGAVLRREIRPGHPPRRVFIKESLSLNRAGKPDILALEEEAAQSPL